MMPPNHPKRATRQRSPWWSAGGMAVGGLVGWLIGRILVPPASADDPFASWGVLAGGGAGLWHLLAGLLGIMAGGVVGYGVSLWRARRGGPGAAARP